MKKINLLFASALALTCSSISYSMHNALVQSAKLGNTNDIESLLNNHSDPNAVGRKNRTALLWASINQHDEVIKILLINSANPNIADEDGMTPLHWAVSQDNHTIIKLLVEYGANPYYVNNKDETPYSLASKQAKIIIDKYRSKYLIKKNREAAPAA